MKTKSLFIVATFLLLASCGGGYNPPVIPGQTPNTPKSPIAQFTYETSHPFYVHFENKSTDATSYLWDFGDGTTSGEASPTHKYNGKGVYKVKLNAYGNSKSDLYTKNVTVVAPTKCYVTGIVYEKIPKNNEYYNIRFTDDYILFETLYWYTDWVMLSSANIPYKYTLQSKKQIDFSISEYVMRLYQNESTSGTGTQKSKWSVYTSDLKSKYAESTTGTASNAKVTLLLEWQ